MVADARLELFAPQRTSEWLVGGGEMGDLVRAHGWSRTPLGAIQSWPQSLRSAVSIMLPSKAQIALFWGPQLITLYNDAYRPVFGGKHPHALGRPIREAWSELWANGLKELFESVLATGEAFWAKDRPFYMERHGYPEETFFDVSYDPVRDESGRVGGVFCIVNETSRRVIGERRLKVLRDLGTVAAQARSAAEAWTLSARVLAAAPLDIPFAEADLEGQAGWPLGLQDVEALRHRMATGAGPWPEPARLVMVLPLGERPDGGAGRIALGVSSRLAFDEDYCSFFQLVAGQVAASIAAARAAEDERRRAEALAEIDRAKTAFFNNVSHEFRTPLTLMLGPLEELKQAFASDPASSGNPHLRQVDLVHRNGLRLLKQVNTLLDFSRIEAGRAQASYEPIDLSCSTAELASVFRSAIEKAGLKFVVDCPPVPEPAYVDRDMWEKIVLNLISNAFKFTLEGEIEVRLRATSAKFELAVRDTGTGIPRDELPRIFERFHRVAGAPGRTHEGSGIGLALVLELVKLHGGTVTVDSALGQGSTFTVAIPTGCRHLPAQRIGASRTEASTAVGATAFVEEALRWLPEAGHAHDQIIPDVAPTNDPDAGSEARARILLADDNADMRDYVRRLLAARYDVEAVADGEAALAAATRNTPDLVLSDIMMPRLDGMQLLARLRADPRTSSIPVILLSARAGEESRVEGFAVGADDYLIKPFSARELLARVGSHVRLKRLRDRSHEALREKREEAEILNEVSRSLGGELDLQKLVQGVTDAGTKLTRAKFGAFFYNATNEQGESYLLYTLSGAPREAFEKFGTPRNTPVFGPTFAGEGIVRSDDITKDPRYGRMAPHHGMPNGHLPVRSYLAVPVIARSGEVLGGLFFGHPEVGVFTEQAERLAGGVAAQAAVAIENARLFEQAQHEIAERKRTEESLRENEERLRLALAAGRMGTWDWNIATDEVTWAPELEAIHGLLPGSFGRSFAAFQKDVHPEDRDRILREIARTLESGEDHHIEYRIVRPDGSLRWVDGRGKLFRDGSGAPTRMVGLCVDVTERKRAENTQQMLLTELNHRVKNTLASVQAIAQQTQTHTRNPAEFVASFAGRLRSLARVHAMLSSTTWQGADLRELIRDQLLSGPVDETRLNVWGPSLHLESHAALHLGMVLHELGTNSCKYGALSVPSGKVTVSWTTDEALHIQWVERGGPPVAAPARRGFGAKLIEQSAKAQGGDAKMLCEREGVTWTINLPLRDRGRSDIASPGPQATPSPAEGTGADANPHSSLAGRRFLVVEDETLIGLDIVAGLEEAGAQVEGPAGTVEKAIELIERAALDGALLDANLRGQPVDEIASALTRRNIPFVFVTGYGSESLPQAFRGVAVIAKPFSRQQVFDAAAQLVAKRSDVVRLRR